MAATKIDAQFEKVSHIFKEILMDAGSQGLSLEEAEELSAIVEDITCLWDAYLDRMIDSVARTHTHPAKAVALAGADVKEMEAARERVRAKLIEQGILLGPTKKVVLH